ncbi:MAG: hypothetical protein IME93_04325 [Proteobacteria bacterium]|nr:hypothetical protein [Pseudomonadota bacterium]
MLITRELAGYQPMDDFLQGVCLRILQRKNLAITVADAVRHLHQSHLQHNCLHPKHVFVKMENNVLQASLIDLEKTKYKLLREQAVYRDLDTLNRRSAVSNTDRLRFLLAYMQKRRVDGAVRQLWQGLRDKSASKRHKS